MGQYDYLERVNNCSLKTMLLNVTDSCNLKCRYCFTHPNPSKMSLETGKQAVTWLINENLFKRKLYKKESLSIAFFGGEPTLRWDDFIVPFIKYMENEIIPQYQNQFDFIFNMTTNGQLLDEQKIQWFKQHNGRFLLSIDGADETQNFNRPRRDGKNSFSHLDEIIPILLKYQPGTCFRSTITPAMVHNLSNDFLYARKKGFTRWFGIPNVRESWSEEQIAILKEEFNKICAIMLRDVFMETMPMSFSWMVSIMRAILYNHYPKLDYIKCGLGTRTVGVATDGSLFSCQENSTYHDETNPFFIGDIWNGIIEERRSYLVNHFTHTNKIFCKENKCDTCLAKKLCHIFSCPSTNFATTNNLLERPEMLCNWFNIVYLGTVNFLLNGFDYNSDQFMMYLKARGVIK